ncbi:MAG: site-specific integrase [Clostridia bacterium]|nr:site-specific integrase [Clostridia bacterium]
MLVTGSIQPNKGKYYAVINLKDENGKRKPKWVNTGLEVKDGNKRKAEKFLQEQLALWNGRNGIFIGTSLAEYLEHWLKTIPHDIRPSTYRGYCGNMNNHIIPYFKQHPVALQDVTPMILEEYYYSLLKPESNLTTGTALSPTTIHHHHQNISKALNDAVREGLIVANPASTVRLPKKVPYRPEYLNKEQLEELNRLFSGSVIELPVFLCSIYGFRRSEVLGLKWKSVDFYNKSITISETLQQSAGGGDYTAAPKTDSSYRTLPMTKRVEEVLLKFKAKQIENQRLMGAYYFSSDYVCTMADGRVISPNYIERVFHSTITKSNLPHITLHLLRHSVASNLLNDGFSVTQVQEWLGHSSAATTLTFYAHVDKTSKLQIANQLDKIDAENGFIQLKNDKKSVSEKSKKIKIRPVKRTK